MTGIKTTLILFHLNNHSFIHETCIFAEKFQTKVTFVNPVLFCISTLQNVDTSLYIYIYICVCVCIYIYIYIYHINVLFGSWIKTIPISNYISNLNVAQFDSFENSW